MKPRHAVPLFAAILLFAATQCELAAQATTRGYDDLLEEARARAAENSWALARDAYAAALPLAPDEDAKRWTRLWLADATWRSEDEPRDWRRRETWWKEHRDALASLVTDTPAGQPHDSYWLAVMKDRLAFEDLHRGSGGSIELQLKLADQLAAEPRSLEATANYLDFLLSELPHEVTSYDLHSGWPTRWLAHLDAGAAIARNPEERARMLVAAARQAESQQSVGTAAVMKRWQSAVAESRGTSVAPLADALEFGFAIRKRLNTSHLKRKRGDFPALIAEARRLLREIEPLQDQSLPMGREAALAATELSRLADSWSRPWLQVEAQSMTHSGKSIHVAFGEAGYSELKFTVFEQPPENWSDREATRYRTYRLDRETINKKDAAEIALGASRIAFDKKLSMQGAESLSWQTDEIEIPSGAIPPGFYTLLVEGTAPSGTTYQKLNLLVSDVVATSVSGGAGSPTVFLYRTEGDSPFADAKVSGILRGRKGSRKIEGTTDHQGALSLGSEPFPGQWDHQFIGRVSGQPVMVAVQAPVAPPQYVADIIIDRPLYKPGETVHWQAVLRERKGGAFVVSRRRLFMSVKDQNAEPLLGKVAVMPNEFGTANGNFAIPETTAPGRFSISFAMTGDADDDGLESDGFIVDNFVPPAITTNIALVSEPDSIRPGNEVKVRVNAAYFSGGPVVGTNVTCKFEVHPYRSWRNPTNGQRDQDLQKWIEDLGKNPQSAVIGTDGTAEFSLYLDPRIPEFSSLSVTSEVLPPGAASITNSANWTITRSGLRIDALGWNNPIAARPGDTVQFKCLINDGRDQPASVMVEAALVELSWNEAWLKPDGSIAPTEEVEKERRSLGIESDWGFPYGWEKLHAGYSRQVVEHAAVATGDDGIVSVSFKVPHPGFYQLRLAREESTIGMMDDEDRLPELAVVAADDSTASIPIKPGAYLFGNSSYVANEPLTFLSVVPDGFGPAMLTVSGETSHQSMKQKMTGRIAWLSVDRPPPFAGMGHASLVSLTDSSLSEAKLSFQVTDPRREIELSIEPGESESQPGSATTVLVRAVDGENRPVKAEVLLSATDESVRKLVASDGDGTQSRFLSYSWGPETSLNQFSVTESEPPGPRTFDPRPGAVWAMSHEGSDEEDVVLSPFEVNMPAPPGYAAMATLAGSRVQADLMDVASAVSVVTKEFLQDIGSVDASTLLEYNTNTEVGGAPGNISKPIITRRFFSSTAAWQPGIVTDANGEAKAKVEYPGNLTQWRLDAYAVGADGNTFGRADVFTRTNLPFQSRIQTPRLLIEGDRSEFGTALLNRTEESMKATAEIAVEGAVSLESKETARKPGIIIPAQDETRVAWPVQAKTPGVARVSTSATTGELSDAMEVPLFVLPDGFWQRTAASACLEGASGRQVMNIQLPDPLEASKANVTVKFSPGHIAAVLDALPYLVDYPYGCVEQTMSRFLPAVVVRQALDELGFSPEEVEQRITSHEPAAARRRRLQSAGILKIDEVTEKSLARIKEAQDWNGGFGWWPGEHRIDPWMTAYVVWGLSIARESGVHVPEPVEANALKALCGWIGETHRASDLLAWSLFAVTRTDLTDEQEEIVKNAFGRAFAKRSELGPSGRACLAVAAAHWGTANQQATLLGNLENGAHFSQAGGLGKTVHWGMSQGYWRASDGAVECTALTLMALHELEPQHALIEPAARWLELNRRSSGWSNTRNTALAVLALSRLIPQESDLDSNPRVEISANGSQPFSIELTRNALIADKLELPIPEGILRPGANEITATLGSGGGTVYAIALASAWSRNEGASQSGHLVDTSREFDRRIPTPTVAGNLRLTNERISKSGAATQGEEVVAVVTLDVSNELEYVAVQVPKPAGCEPLNPLSGWDATLVRIDENDPSEASQKDGIAIYREEHDDRSVFFLNHVEAGKWEIRFGLRAVFAGDYRAAPVTVEAMYAPEIRANSDARRLRIEQAERH